MREDDARPANEPAADDGSNPPDGSPIDGGPPDGSPIDRADGEAAERAEAAIDGDTDAPLAVVVEKLRAETAIESLRSEGVYDDDRRVREDGPETVALPVAEPPTETRVREVLRQVDPDYRTRDLADRLAERGWTAAEIDRAPTSWAVIGSVILVTLPEDCPDGAAVGEALLDLHGEATSVLADEGVENDGEAGTYREPRTRLLAGESNTETIHAEAGTRYGLDPARVMFSPGNEAERTRMGEVVETDERVFDMFAGIGYFTLPMARAGARVTAAEINPDAFRYLLENAVLNDVQERVDAYRADCREVASRVDADRVVMGYYGASDGTDDDGHGTRSDEAIDFLPAALEALRPGGVLHYHEATPESDLWSGPIDRLERGVADAGRTLEVVGKRRVKSHSPGVWHVAVDARID